MKATLKSNDEKSLGDHAEAWWKEQGQTVPSEGSPEYEAMYSRWYVYAFHNFDGKGEELTQEQVKALIALPADKVEELVASTGAGSGREARRRVIQFQFLGDPA